MSTPENKNLDPDYVRRLHEKYGDTRIEKDALAQPHHRSRIDGR